MKRRHIVFDLDGTLVDSALHCAGILNDMLAERGAERRIDRAETVPHMSYGGAHLVTTLLGEQCVDAEMDLTDFRRRYASLPTPSACVFPGVIDGIATLADQGFVLAICSNKPQALCDKIVDELGLRFAFASIVGGRADLAAKPDRAMLDLNLSEMGATPETAILVGDSEVDQAIAAAVGVPFWLVDYGYAAACWTPVADARFERFGDVVAAITEVH